jgi:hypothetical protein
MEFFHPYALCTCFTCGERFTGLKGTITCGKCEELYKQPYDYTMSYRFWQRLQAFVKNVEVNDPMSQEEKEMLINISINKIRELGLNSINTTE